MIIIAIVLAIIIGKLCASSLTIFGSMSSLTFFYVMCISLYVISRAYFLNKTRINLKSIASSTKHFKIISIVVAFICAVLGLIEFIQMLGQDHTTLTLLSSAGLLASGFSLLLLVVLTNRGKFQNQLAASIGTVPILWLVLELLLIFKNNLSNPYLREYIFAIFLCTFTSFALYYCSSAFCVASKTNYFKEHYVLSVFVCVVYAVASLSGYVSSADIATVNLIGACGLFNVFMLPYYITAKSMTKKIAEIKPTSTETPTSAE